MTPQLAVRIALRAHAKDPRPAVRDLVALIRHQLRTASTSNSPTLREVLAGNVERLSEIAK